MNFDENEIQYLQSMEEDDDDDQDYNPVEDDVEDEDEDDELERREEDEAASSTAEQSEDDRTYDDLISRRTRSKFHIEETPKDALDLPDISPDLYGAGEDVDEDWSEFLNSLFTDQPSKMLDDDEVNDPEYDFLSDVRAVASNENFEISRKELDSISENQTIETLPREAITWTISLTKENFIQIYEQITQHVQLLAQTYTLTRQNPSLVNIAATARKHLREVEQLSSQHSLLRTYNLSPALEMMKCNPIAPIKIRGKPSRLLPAISPEAVSIFVQHPWIFSSTGLLPTRAYGDISSGNTKVQFTHAEDYLIALGIDQLKEHEDDSIRIKYLKYLQNVMMPTKTLPQLKTRIKNMKRRFEEGNPLCQYLKHGTLPAIVKHECPLHAPHRYPAMAQLPDWLQAALRNAVAAQSRKRMLAVSPFKQANMIIKKYRQLQKMPVANPYRSPFKEAAKEAAAVNAEAKVHKEEVDKDATAGQVAGMSASSKTGDANSEKVLKDDDAEHLEDDDECENDVDDECDLAALMMASSTIMATNRLRGKVQDGSAGMKKEGKKSLQTKQKESTLRLLSDDWDDNDADKAEKDKVLADYYLNKAREALQDDADYVRFLQCLSDFHETRSSTTSSPSSASIKTIYVKIAKILDKCDASEVLDEFVLFLTPQEAEEIDKSFEYLRWQRFRSFIRKVEVLSDGDPQVLARLHRALSHLKQNEAFVDKRKLRATVSRALNGHAYMMKQFATLFLDEKPDESLFAHEEYFDEIEIPTSDDEDASAADGNAIFERFEAPLTEEELKYGTNECPCTFCHQNLVEGKDNQALTRHCVSCSLRFVGGRVFLVQGHKKLVPAKVDILGSRDERSATSQEQAEELSDSCEEQEPRGAKRQRTSSSSDSGDASWTPEDDKLLLQMMQTMISKNPALVTEVFQEISAKLRRTESAVTTRFNLLMDTLKSKAKDEGSEAEPQDADKTNRSD